MKKILFVSIAFLTIHVNALAQAPQLFNYQGIARDENGTPLSKQTMTLKISVLQSADAPIPEYEETQIVKTNEFGLYTLQIGNGTSTSPRALKDIQWETGNKYIKVAIDPTGGSNYVDAGITQLLSVPYAMYANKAGVAANNGNDKTRTGAVNSNAAHLAGDANYLSKFTALNTIGKSVLFESGAGKIGLGTTSPGGNFSLFTAAAGVVEHIRMQDVNTTGAGRFTMYNDGLNSYATFTKYGSAYPGTYPGVPSLYPLANLLAFGNNQFGVGDGHFIISNSGNTGISIFKAGTTKLKFHADFTTENVGIGGNASPAARVHLNNTDGNIMTVRITNNTTGHSSGDGLEISNTGNDARIYNSENANLTLGVNSNPTVITISPSGTTEFAGQIKINGGTPALGNVLVSDASGLATWQTPPLGPTGPAGPAGPAGANGQGGITIAGDGIAVTGTGTVLDPYVVSNRTYTIGLWPELGGYVFWVSPDGKHGLVAETVDQGVAGWYNSHQTISNPANHSVNGAKFRDWRLPSLFELGELFLQKVAIGGFSNAPYWSGSEYDGTDALSKNFNNGNETGFDKFGDALNVRTVRSF